MKAAAKTNAPPVRFLRVEQVSTFSRSVRDPHCRGEDVVINFSRQPDWHPYVRFVFGGFGRPELVRTYQPGRGD